MSQLETKKKKPKPLFGLFRSNKGNHSSKPSTSSTNSNTSNQATSPPPVQPMMGYDPYAPVHSRPVDVTKKPTITAARRPRSKSTAANTTQRVTAAQRAHSMKVREETLSKLCGTSPVPTPSTSSPASRSSRASPVQRPKVPQMPQFTPPGSPAMRKHASAHDLRQAARHQYDAIHNYPMPLPSNSTSRAGSPQRTGNMSPRRRPQQYDDDDDVPLAVTMRGGLLDDQAEEDDKDLVPIATALGTRSGMRSAADKYKEKVKQQLDMSSDDDDIPIQTAVSRRSMGRRKRPGLHDTAFVPQAV
ncbi:hypothetical protein BJV82DRAFT_592480 [Fennellomyces sp. T-0311]|nr:hypothetical protein BJV82DRAFT_592480 [Fennellomyces sp. T-0311]